MLGWIYNKLGDQNLYALKLHEALQKLLDIEENDEVQWVTRCIRLAMLFLNRCKYSAARQVELLQWINITNCIYWLLNF